MEMCRHCATRIESRKLDSGHCLTYEQCLRCWAWLPLGPARDEDVTNVQNEIAALEIFEAALGVAEWTDAGGIAWPGGFSPQRAAGWRRLEVDPFEMSASSYREGDLARAIYDHHIGGDLHVLGTP
jgi:hypothetical protein